MVSQSCLKSLTCFFFFFFLVRKWQKGLDLLPLKIIHLQEITMEPVRCSERQRLTQRPDCGHSE